MNRLSRTQQDRLMVSAQFCIGSKGLASPSCSSGGRPLHEVVLSLGNQFFPTIANPGVPDIRLFFSTAGRGIPGGRSLPAFSSWTGNCLWRFWQLPFPWGDLSLETGRGIPSFFLIVLGSSRLDGPVDSGPHHWSGGPTIPHSFSMGVFT